MCFQYRSSATCRIPILQMLCWVEKMLSLDIWGCDDVLFDPFVWWNAVCSFLDWNEFAGCWWEEGVETEDEEDEDDDDDEEEHKKEFKIWDRKMGKGNGRGESMNKSYRMHKGTTDIAMSLEMYAK